MQCSDTFADYYTNHPLPLNLDLLKLFYHTDLSQNNFKDVVVAKEMACKIIFPNVCATVSAIREMEASRLFYWMYDFVTQRDTEIYGQLNLVTRHLTYALYLKLNQPSDFDKECLKNRNFGFLTKESFLKMIKIEIIE
eukprot:NODE_72_length_24857_cov_0.454399.p18 type:complete len:138 gc:universal NODE_72_length_24857_cov_0.454399:13325-13738(+)